MDPTEHPVDRGILFSREEYARSGGEILHRGRWGNADIHLFRRGNEVWVVKDFLHCPFIVRHTWGAFMVGREMSAMRKLQGFPGFPRDPFRLDRFAVAYRYETGRDIGRAAPGLLTPAFFGKLESLVAEMHRRGVAHLDLRSGSNALVTGAGEPYILDFQSHVSLDGLPRFLRNLLIDVDRSGVYKHWARLAPGTLGEERSALLERMNRWRRFWVLKGYLGFRQR
jgi:hypothetical protein